MKSLYDRMLPEVKVRMEFKMRHFPLLLANIESELKECYYPGSLKLDTVQSIVFYGLKESEKDLTVWHTGWLTKLFSYDI